MVWLPAAAKRVVAVVFGRSAQVLLPNGVEGGAMPAVGHGIRGQGLPGVQDVRAPHKERCQAEPDWGSDAKVRYYSDVS